MLSSWHRLAVIINGMGGRQFQKASNAYGVPSEYSRGIGEGHGRVRGDGIDLQNKDPK